MSLKIKGAIVEGNMIVGEVFDVGVEINQGRNDAMSCLVGLRREQDKLPLVRMSIFHPEIYPTSEENWTDHLVNMINISPNHEVRLSPSFFDESGFNRISTQPNIGQRFFRFHGTGHDLVILVDYGETPRDTPGKVLKKFSQRNDTLESRVSSSVFFQDRVDILITNRRDREIRTLWRKTPLTTEEMFDAYLNGIPQKYLKAEGFIDPRESRDCSLSDLVFKRIGAFEYVESLGGAVNITYEDSPALKLMGELERIILERKNEDERFGLTQCIMDVHTRCVEMDKTVYEKTMVQELVSFYKSLK